MIVKYIILIIRNFWRFRLYSILNLMGLAIAMAVATLIFVYVREEASYDRHFPKADRIYRVANFSTNQARARNWANGPPVMAEELLDYMPEVESVTRLRPINESIFVYYKDSIKVFSHKENDGFYIDSSFLEIFDVEILYGNNKDPISKPGSLILTESLSRKFFGEEIPVGKTLIMRGKPWEITAVCRDFSEQQHFHPAFFLPWQNFVDMIIGVGLSDLYYSRGWSGVYTYLLLNDNVNGEDLTERLFDFRVSFYSEFAGREEVIEGGKFVLQPLLDIHLKSQLEQEIEANGNIIYIYVSSLAAIFILVIAGVNYVNLATVKAFKRMKEIGIRKVAGASRQQLINQFLGEALFMSLLSGLTSILLMDLLLPVFNRITGNELQSFDLLSMDNTFMLIGLVLLLSLGAGLYPALFASHISPIRAMKELKDPDSSTNKVRIGLVILQFTVSVFMILSTIIIYRQMEFFLEKDMGWNKENLVALTLNGRAYSMAAENPGTFKDELNSLAFIKGSAFTSGLPGDRFSVEGLTPDVPRDEEFDDPSIRFLRVDEDFIPLMGIEIIEGRNLKHTVDSISEFIINESAVSVLQLQDAVGIPAESMFGQKGDIVGVTENFHYASLHQIIEPLVLEVNYDPEFRELWYQYLILKLTPGELSEKISLIKNKIEELAEGYIMEYTFLEDNINKNYQSEERLKELLSAFALLAIFISCLGLFGLSAFSAELKTKEMGIRKAMGASVVKIAYLMSRNFLVYVIIALILALPLGFYTMNSWLQNFAYHIGIQWWEFILASFLAVTITLISVGYQALRSGMANPVNALRYE